MPIFAALLLAALLVCFNLFPASGEAADAAPADASVEQMMAGLSDEDVRQLLIEELRKEALADTQDSQQMKGPAFFLSRLLNLLSREHDDNKNEIEALFASLPAVGPDLHRVFVKL
ncbi:MAG: hypothetical protein P8X39_04275 [Desulfofustis sp.]